jgi:hypothetical protein
LFSNRSTSNYGYLLTQPAAALCVSFSSYQTSFLNILIDLIDFTGYEYRLEYGGTVTKRNEPNDQYLAKCVDQQMEVRG